MTAHNATAAGCLPPAACCLSVMSTPLIASTFTWCPEFPEQRKTFQVSSAVNCGSLLRPLLYRGYTVWAVASLCCLMHYSILVSSFYTERVMSRPLLVMVLGFFFLPHLSHPLFKKGTRKFLYTETHCVVQCLAELIISIHSLDTVSQISILLLNWHSTIHHFYLNVPNIFFFSKFN